MESNKRNIRGLKLWLFGAMFLLFGSVRVASAQTFGEWFNQKKTQEKYLLQQIAGLQVYLGYAKKGYEVVSGGLDTFRDITKGEFDLHGAFFSSLKTASPFIRKNSKVAEIIALQVSIGKAFNGIVLDGLSFGNRLYVADVREKVMEECDADLEELLLVITSGKLEMSDDERLKRLDKVYASMRSKAAFVQDFTGKVDVLVRQTIREQRSIEQLRRYYEGY